MMQIQRLHSASPQKALLPTLLMTLLVTGLIFYFWQHLIAQQRQHLEDQFLSEVTEVRTEIDEHITAYGQVLRGGRSLFLASDNVTRQEWHSYISNIELGRDYPGIQGVGYAISIPAADLGAHQQLIRSEGYPDYRVWPEGKRDLYTAIIYLEPFDWRNKRAFGYDMFAEPIRHEAMSRARDSGSPALSGKVLLVQETNEKVQAGTLLYVPLYRKDVPLNTVQQRRKALIGWVYSPYRMHDMIEGMLRERSEHIHLRIYDQDIENPDNLLYDSLDSETKPHASLVRRTLRIETAGRTWTLEFEALPSYAEAIGLHSLHKEASGMMLIGLLLVLLTWNLFNTQRKAGLARDLTTSLRDSEERWSFALEGSGDGVWDWDIVSGKVFFSPRFRQMLGLTEDELGSDIEAWKQRVHPNDIATVNHAIESHLRGETPEFTAEHRLQHKNGEYIWVLGRGKVIKRAEDNRPLRLVGTKSDITQRKQNEENIRLLSQSVHQAGEAVIMTDAKGNIQYVNPAFTAITGYSEAEAIGQNPRMLSSGVQNHHHYETMWSNIKSGRTWQGRMVDRKKDGSFYPAMLTISPIFGEDGSITHYVGMQQDLQEYEDMEARFQQAQKMEALGTLVGGIAHDFNNTLAGITGNLYLARKKILDNPAVVAHLDKIETLSFRAAAVINQLLTFSRKSRTEMAPVAIGAFLKEVAKMHRVTMPEDISLKTEIESAGLCVTGDINLLQQVLINLLNNARDALEGVPEPAILIRLEEYTADKNFMANHPGLTSDELACITVSDNGRGITAENIAHVFEPFFTTKAVGKGTGLGLSMVYGAIQSHNGVITVESKPGMGTRFHIYLPRIERPATEEAGEASAPVILGHGETILLVDDHDESLAINSEVLESLNYTILTACNGREAVDLYLSHQADIRLVILDVVMPVMSGNQACKAIREINPQARVMFATGYDRLNVLKDDELKDTPLISKPFVIGELSRMIDKLLNTGNG